jgi:hypothetical protein
MGIQGVTGNSFFANIAPLSQTSGQAGAPGFTPSGPATGGGTSVQGQFLSKLQALEQSDPEAAKKMLTELADKLRARAAKHGATSAGSSKLADVVQKAADTGDLTELLKTAQGGGSTWSRGAGAYGQTMAVTRASM